MEKRNVMVTAHILVPVLIMFILAFISFSEFTGDIEGSNLIITSLLVIFPVLFLVQGLICGILRANIFISLGISLASFVVILLVWLNSSALSYILIYLIMGSLGFGINYLTRKDAKKIL